MGNRKKIIHVTESLEGGVITFLREITNSIDAEYVVLYGKRNVDISKISPTFNAERVSFKLWNHAQREIKLIKDIKASVFLYRFLKKEKPNVVHLHSSKAGFLGRIVCFLFKNQVPVYNPHGVAFTRKDISNTKKLIYTYLEKIGGLFPCRVIAVSVSEGGVLQEKGIKNTVINNGINISKEIIDRSTTTSFFTIVTSGRITPQKNPSLFNEIASSLVNQKNIQFIWIGDGPERSLLKSKNIRITGWQQPDEVKETLLASDLYLSTALWEGLPYSVLEAMNLRLPLLLSNCIGNCDLVKAQDQLYTTSNEASSFIKTLIKNPSMKEALSISSYEHLQKHFNVTEMISLYKGIYKS